MEPLLSQSLVSLTQYSYMHDYTACMVCAAPHSFLLLVAGTPTGVTANRTGYTSVLVFWNAPSQTPAGYEVFYQTSAAGDNTRLSGGNTTSCSQTELVLTGLTLEELYYIFVVAFGNDGAPLLPSLHSQPAMIMLCEFIFLNEISKYAVITAIIYYI